jgi:phosphonate transport system substrate-binding protein
MKVVAHGLWHYHHLLEGLADDELHIVWLPPVLALRATARARCVPIAIPVRHGVSTYATALFSRADSSIRSLDDVRGGVRAAWVDRQSAAGYLIIRALLRSQGVDLEQAFVHEKFLGTHDAVAAAVREGEVDVGATFAYPHAELGMRSPKAAGWGHDDVNVIAYVGSIPSDIIAANCRLPPAVRNKVQQALVELDDKALAAAARALLGADRFVAPTPEHLSKLYDILDNLEEQQGPAHSLFPPARRG